MSIIQTIYFSEIAFSKTDFMHSLSKLGLKEFIEDDSGPCINFPINNDKFDDYDEGFILGGFQEALERNDIAYDVYYEDPEKYTYSYRPMIKGFCNLIKYCYPGRNIEALKINLYKLRVIMESCHEDYKQYYEQMKILLYEKYPDIPSLEEWTSAKKKRDEDKNKEGA